MTLDLTWAMRCAGATLLLGAAASVVGAQQKISRRSAVGATSPIRVNNLSGTVRVIGWDRDSLVVTGVIPDSAKFFFGAGAYGAKMGVDVPGNMEPKPALLELHVPKGARVWVKTGNADIEVSGVTGGLDLNIVGGHIKVTGSPRELNAEAMDGSIEIDGSPPWLRAKSATGAITLKGSSEDAGFTTVSGTVTVSGAKLERARFESVTGDMSVAMTPVAGGNFDFESHSGTIDLRLPGDADAQVDVSTVHGTIKNGLTAARPVPMLDARGNELAFRVGKGGALVRIRSFKGAVLLGRQ